MARYVKTVDIWTLSDDERAALQPGQWVRAGEDGPIGHIRSQHAQQSFDTYSLRRVQDKSGNNALQEIST